MRLIFILIILTSKTLTN